MEVLSSTASAFAVVSLALQLAESIKQLHEFWESVKEAPGNIYSMIADLGLLSAVLSGIAGEAQHSQPDDTLEAVLNSCTVKVEALTALITELEPGFASKRSSIRKWTALKAVFKNEKLEKFLGTLEGMKTTLLLAQQTYHGRSNRHYNESHQQAMMTICQNLKSVDLNQMSITVISSSEKQLQLEEHFIAMRTEISHMADNVCNPVYRFGLKKALANAVHENLRDSADIDFGEQMNEQMSAWSQGTSSKWLVNGRTPQSDTHSPQKSRNICTLDNSQTVSESMFGTIYTEFRTTSKRIPISCDSSTYSETPHCELQTILVFHPALWLVKLGLSYSLRARVSNCSVKGWNHNLVINRPVPDDALIFEFSKEGNLSAIRSLISRGMASVRDIDSYGKTALWFAAYGHHAKLCEFLISAGADKDAQIFRSPSSEAIEFVRTPLLAITSNILSLPLKLNCDFETLRLFIDLIDFTDENNVIWPLLYGVCESAACTQNSASEYAVSLLLWIFRSFSFDVRPSFHECELWHLLRLSLGVPVQDVLEFFIRLSGNQIDAVETPRGFSAVHEGVICCLGLVSLCLQKGANPHLLGKDRTVSPHCESPTSLAIYNRTTFNFWRGTLKGLKVDFGKFAQQEISQAESLLAQAGWDAELLFSLFQSLKDESYLRFCGYWKCRDCLRNYYVGVEPRWLQKLERIKRRLDPKCRPIQTFIEIEDLDDFGCIIPDTTTIPTDANSSLEPLEPKISVERVENDVQGRIGGNSSDRTSTAQIDILNLNFEIDEILCIWCWENYKHFGYNPRSWRYDENEDDYFADNFENDSADNEDVPSDDGSSDQEFSPFLIHR